MPGYAESINYINSVNLVHRSKIKLYNMKQIKETNEKHLKEHQVGVFIKKGIKAQKTVDETLKRLQEKAKLAADKRK